MSTKCFLNVLLCSLYLKKWQLYSLLPSPFSPPTPNPTGSLRCYYAVRSRVTAHTQWQHSGRHLCTQFARRDAIFRLVFWLIFAPICPVSLLQCVHEWCFDIIMLIFGMICFEIAVTLVDFVARLVYTPLPRWLPPNWAVVDSFVLAIPNSCWW